MDSKKEESNQIFNNATLPLNDHTLPDDGTLISGGIGRTFTLRSAFAIAFDNTSLRNQTLHEEYIANLKAALTYIYISVGVAGVLIVFCLYVSEVACFKTCKGKLCCDYHLQYMLKSQQAATAASSTQPNSKRAPNVLSAMDASDNPLKHKIERYTLTYEKQKSAKRIKNGSESRVRRSSKENAALTASDRSLQRQTEGFRNKAVYIEGQRLDPVYIQLENRKIEVTKSRGHLDSEVMQTRSSLENSDIESARFVRDGDFASYLASTLYRPNKNQRESLVATLLAKRKTKKARTKGGKKRKDKTKPKRKNPTHKKSKKKKDK